MTDNAAEEGQVQEDDLEQHQGTEEERETSKTSGGDRAEQSGALPSPPERPPMITPWYSDIDDN